MLLDLLHQHYKLHIFVFVVALQLIPILIL
jgi:hypothetical protein